MVELDSPDNTNQKRNLEKMNIDFGKERPPIVVRPTTLPAIFRSSSRSDELRELSELNPIRSTFHIVAEWTLILTAIYLCRRFFNPVVYLLTVAFIGARQHALLILMHDGVHYRLFRGRRLNDWTAEIILAWPNLISARAYRKNHFAHHRF